MNRDVASRPAEGALELNYVLVQHYAALRVTC